MITINLLPESARKVRTVSLHDLPRSPLALVIGGALIGLWLVLAAAKGLYQTRLGQLKTRMQQLQPTQGEAEALRASVDTLRTQQQLYQRISQARSQWARSLNALSDVVPDGLWLRELVIEPKEKVEFKGSIVAQGGEEMVRLRRLVQDLKSDPRFLMPGWDLQIDSIKSVPDGQIEVLEFAMTYNPAQRQPARKPSTKKKR
ncbi:MAG: hypothetical protein HYY91_05975 [Candidatus Omnitrophica bacterium]|nr:hypothetical protein [Candidatus Omnitrophota bacterium]